MFVPGFIINMITFPGVIVHELAHQLFCRLYKVPVFKVVYFQVGNPSGYVLHETPPKKWQSLMISIGPFILNTLIGALVAFPGALPVFTFQNTNILHYLLLYLGASIAMHAFPSTGDAEVIWQSVKDDSASLAMKIIGYPTVGLIYLGAIGSFIWLDLLYGMGVAFGFPKLVVALLA